MQQNVTSLFVSWIMRLRNLRLLCFPLPLLLAHRGSLPRCSVCCLSRIYSLGWPSATMQSGFRFEGSFKVLLTEATGVSAG